MLVLKSACMCSVKVSFDEMRMIIYEIQIVEL